MAESDADTRADSTPQTGEPAEEPVRIEAEDARAGDIILRKRWERTVFIAGLAGIVILVAVVALVSSY